MSKEPENAPIPWIVDEHDRCPAKLIYELIDLYCGMHMTKLDFPIAFPALIVQASNLIEKAGYNSQSREEVYLLMLYSVVLAFHSNPEAYIQRWKNEHHSQGKWITENPEHN